MYDFFSFFFASHNKTTKMAKKSQLILVVVIGLIIVAAVIMFFSPNPLKENFYFQVSRCNPKCSGAYYGKPATFQFDTIPSEGVPCANEQCTSYGMIRGCSTVPAYGTGLSEYSRGCRADATQCGSGMPSFTPSFTPSMTPSFTPSMTPSFTPSIAPTHYLSFQNTSWLDEKSNDTLTFTNEPVVQNGPYPIPGMFRGNVSNSTASGHFSVGFTYDDDKIYGVMRGDEWSVQKDRLYRQNKTLNVQQVYIRDPSMTPMTSQSGRRFSGKFTRNGDTLDCILSFGLDNKTGTLAVSERGISVPFILSKIEEPNVYSISMTIFNKTQTFPPVKISFGANSVTMTDMQGNDPQVFNEVMK